MNIRNLFVRIPKDINSPALAYIEAAIQLLILSLLILSFLISFKYVLIITLVFIVYGMICFALSANDKAEI